MGKRLGTTLCHSRLRRMTVPLLAIYIVYLVSANYQIQHQTILNNKSEALRVTRLKNIVEYPQDKYNIVPDIELQEKSYDVDGDTEITLCTQTSLSNLFRITSTAQTWDGKISIAVFAFDESVLEAQQYIKILRRCSQNVSENVRFHLVFPVDRPPKPMKISKEDLNCRKLFVLTEKFNGKNYASKHGVPYPVNVLRNVALMYANTPYVINMDIDFLPSKNAKPEMEKFLEGLNETEREKKLLYVLPSFEANISRTDLLKSKAGLLKSFHAGHVRQFTMKKCDPCHKPTNFPRWLALPYPSEMAVAYTARFKYSYEPFYVAQKKRLPMFDSRFKQYGLNRYSQICEAYFSGFDFAVMNNAFVVHDGFKSFKEYSHNKAKQKDYNRNHKLFVQVFLRDLKLKYPNSKRRCS